MGEESPEKLFKHAVWDAAATIVYVSGALAVHYLLKAFDSEGVPTIVKVGLIAMEIGFVLVAIGSLISATIMVIRNIKDLIHEFRWKWLRSVFRVTNNRSGAPKRWLAGIVCGVLIFSNIFVAAFVQNGPIRTILTTILIGLLGSLLLPLIVHTIGGGVDRPTETLPTVTVQVMSWVIFIWFAAGTAIGLLFRILHRDIISELFRLFGVG